MKAEDILKAIEDTDEALIQKALPKRKRKRFRGSALIAAALALVILGGILLYPWSKEGNSMFTVARAVYPETAPCPYSSEYSELFTDTESPEFKAAYDKWYEKVKERRINRSNFEGDISSFVSKSIRMMLGENDSENRVCSPLGLYFGLAMLAEIADGSSRDQILELLGYDSIEALRRQSELLWKANYSDDGQLTSILASSLWTDNGVRLKEEALNSLREHYFASAFRGETGSEKMNKALREWINEQTGGLLEEYTQDIALEPMTLLSIITTVFFEGSWQNKFIEKYIESGIFHGASGEGQARYLKGTTLDSYYWGEKFSATAKDFEGGSKMWFILPDEGVSVSETLEDEEVMDFILKGEKTENKKYVRINLAVPEFDISYSAELSEGLKELGISEIFDFDEADVSFTNDKGLPAAVSNIQQASRVAIDKDGCTASSYTEIMVAGSAMPEDEVDFILDRPFIFIITNMDGVPVFAGTVHDIK